MWPFGLFKKKEKKVGVACGNVTTTQLKSSYSKDRGLTTQPQKKKRHRTGGITQRKTGSGFSHRDSGVYNEFDPVENLAAVALIDEVIDSGDDYYDDNESDDGNYGDCQSNDCDFGSDD